MEKKQKFGKSLCLLNTYKNSSKRKKIEAFHAAVEP